MDRKDAEAVLDDALDRIAQDWRNGLISDSEADEAEDWAYDKFYASIRELEQ